MVGDGANDAAAIRAASVGIGVAARGSDPARTAADVVLLDGRIEALLDALDEGQQLWRRVQSAVSMLLGGNTGEVCFALITSLLTGRSVLNARQMLLVNMLTDALPAAALAVSTQTSTAEVDRDEAAMWRAIGIRGCVDHGRRHAGLADGQRDRHSAPRRDGRVDRPGRHAAGADARRLARPAGGVHDGRVVRGAGGGGQHAGGEPGVRLHTGGPAGLGSGLAWRPRWPAALSALAPELLYRASEALRRRIESRADEDDGSVFDDEDAGLRQDRVDLAQRRRQQTNTDHDQRIVADAAQEFDM